MRDFQIITDTDSDIPYEYVKANDIILVPQYTLLDGVTYEGAEGIDAHDFYVKMAAGSEPKSQAINPSVCEERFRQALDKGRDVLYLSFSSALSGSYNTAVMTGKNLEEEYEGAKVKVIDTLAASMGETLMVMKAVEMKNAGKSLEETAEWIEKTKLNVVHLFTVDTLKYLHRGGRISKATEVVGTLAGVKPILNVDNNGKLGSFGKERGRKKSLTSIVNTMGEKLTGEWKDFNKTVAIAHGDCIEDVKLVEKMITDRFGITDFVVNDINPSIGVHSGPGTVALFFYGESR